MCQSWLQECNIATHLSSCCTGESSTTLASPLGCWRIGLSSESGRTAGSTRRGEAFSATESEGARGECAWKGCFFVAGL